MYDASRLATMTEVNLWPLTTPQRDPLATYPKSKALTVTPTGGRAQIRVQQKLSTAKAIQSMTERPSARIYEQTATYGDERCFSKEANRYNISHLHLSTPEDPPAASIPQTTLLRRTRQHYADTAGKAARKLPTGNFNPK